MRGGGQEQNGFQAAGEKAQGEGSTAGFASEVEGVGQLGREVVADAGIHGHVLCKVRWSPPSRAGNGLPTLPARGVMCSMRGSGRGQIPAFGEVGEGSEAH